MAGKILIVDDEPDVVRFLTELLNDAGYDTVSAGDGREALEVMRKEKPDLVTLDLQMPHDTGTDFYRQAHRTKELSQIPIIVISGIAGRHLAIRRPLAVIDKPIDKTKLLETIHQAIG
jgi:CheY-like chemotaxis protein